MSLASQTEHQKLSVLLHTGHGRKACGLQSIFCHRLFISLCCDFFNYFYDVLLHQLVLEKKVNQREKVWTVGLVGKHGA